MISATCMFCGWSDCWYLNTKNGDPCPKCGDSLSVTVICDVCTCGYPKTQEKCPVCEWGWKLDDTVYELSYEHLDPTVKEPYYRYLKVDERHYCSRSLMDNLRAMYERLSESNSERRPYQNIQIKEIVSCQLDEFFKTYAELHGKHQMERKNEQRRSNRDPDSIPKDT